MGLKVGIDLGTTFSAVAVMDEAKGMPYVISNTLGEKITPSVIQFCENGEIVVGTEAKEAFEAGEFGCTSAFKRSMGNDRPYCFFGEKSYTSEDLSAIMLRYLKEETEAVMKEPIDEAVVTVPAYFESNERRATMRAARKAGLKIRQIINEPTAAAMNYGMKHWRENAIVMVYDLGGGTFDVTLVQMKKGSQMESLRTTGNHMLGGKDWDESICMLIESRIESETGYSAADYPEIHSSVMRKAENVKKQLSSRETARASIRIPDYGEFTTMVSREEFETATKHLLSRTVTLCENLLRELEIGWQDITDILLVGGSTRMPQVPAYLEKISGHKPLMKVHPDEAVALGAAIQVHLPLPEYTVISMAGPEKSGEEGSGLFKFRRKSAQSVSEASDRIALPGPVGRERALENVLSISYSDVVAHAMGVLAVNEEGTHYINKIIVPANQRIPVKCAEEFQFYTSPGKDNELEIYMMQDEQGSKKLSECNVIGKYVAYGISHDSNDNPTRIRIQYSYDVNGLVHVQVRQGNAATDLPVREEPVPVDMTEFDRPIDARKMQARETVSVAMAIDVSGSMSGSPIKEARRAMKNFIDQFGSGAGGTSVGLIAVSDRSQIVQPLTSDLGECRKSVDKIKECMTGICNGADPFDDIHCMLKKAGGRRIGIVLADGEWANKNRAIEKAEKCHREGIEIVGVGFGYADRPFLQKISSGSIDSMFIRQEELTDSFGKIAQEIRGNREDKGGRAGGSSVTATWLAINEQ